MREVKLIKLEDTYGAQDPNSILMLPYWAIEDLEERIVEIKKELGTLFGIVPPYSGHSLEFNIRCAARMRDRLPEDTIYCPVTTGFAREGITSVYHSGFKHILIPRRVFATEYDHFFQTIDKMVLDGVTLHVAGGKFSNEHWNLDRWSWSKDPWENRP